jgi:hypothetical protein
MDKTPQEIYIQGVSDCAEWHRKSIKNMQECIDKVLGQTKNSTARMALEEQRASLDMLIKQSVLGEAIIGANILAPKGVQYDA